MRKAVTLVCSVFALAIFISACDAPEDGGGDTGGGTGQDQQQQDF